jgi:hypothetical protein
VTLRCLREDLKVEPPPVEIDLGSLEHRSSMRRGVLQAFVLASSRCPASALTGWRAVPQGLL